MRVVEDDRQALEALYRRRFGTFVRIATAITGDDGLAQDAVQEGFARALRSLKKFRGEAPLDAWVWRIVLNAARDAGAAAEGSSLTDDTGVPAPSANGSSSEFARWIAVLPPRQRLAVFLRYAADLDYRSIALVLDVEVGTVSATLHAAHEALRRSFEEAST